MTRDEQMYEQGFDDGMEASGCRASSFAVLCAWGAMCGVSAAAITAIGFLTWG